MHPVFFQIGGLPVHTFGLLMGSGFLVGILYAMRQARKWGLDPDALFNLSFWIMLSGVLGARVVYILVDLLQHGSGSEFVEHPLRLLAIWEGGLVWYGGLIGATAVVIGYGLKYRMPIWRVCDVLMPATFIGLGLGRIGCLMAGDDFGKPTDVPWAITFNHPDALVYPSSLLGQPLHPTQLYMSVKAFSIALLCHLFLKHRKRFDGQIFTIGFMIYPILRSLVELLRGDRQRGFFPGTGEMLSTSQGIGIVIFVFGIGMLVLLARRAAPKWQAEILE